MLLPIEFRDLQRFVAVFGLSDDVVREESEASASSTLCEEFVHSIWPRLEAINLYLDEHDDDSAHQLGRLAEVACEVAIRMKR